MFLATGLLTLSVNDGVQLSDQDQFGIVFRRCYLCQNCLVLLAFASTWKP